MKPVALVVVSSTDCPPCEAFVRWWETVAKEWPNVTFVKHDITTPEGMNLAQKHMIMAAPGILLNDEVVSVGGYNEKQFLDKLTLLSKD